MNANTIAAFVGLIGLALCGIPLAFTAWEVGRVRKDVPAARRLGRVMIGTSALGFPILMWIALPRYFEPTFGIRTPVIDGVPDRLLILIAACITYLVGLAWMIQLYRTSHLEPDGSSWRYRDF